jgi:threonine dehydratase
VSEATPAITFACEACGSAADSGPLGPFRCSGVQAGDDLDHLLARRLDVSRLRFAQDDSAHPFLRRRELLSAWQVWIAAGRDDAEFVGMVERLDRAIAGIEGHGFAITPFTRAAALSGQLGFDLTGGVWIKDETGNVAGSHKARHLMGVVLHLDVMERLGRLPPRDQAPPLAIASCGNAALAGAVLARAAGRRLRVFVPEEADPAMVARLGDLGAAVEVCRRAVPSTGGSGAGDPSVAAFRCAVEGGAIPFTCQGTECGIAIEGGETLGWEMIEALGEGDVRLDPLFVQVGGGALASACVRSFEEAIALGEPTALPRLHAVQGAAVSPLARAYHRVRERALWSLEPETGEPEALDRLSAACDPGGRTAEWTDDAAAADWLRERAGSPGVREALRYARQHRSRYMWPWERPARSRATGILDDETYDWMAILAGTIESGGFPVVVDEATLAEAHALARTTTPIRVDTTGAAGLAGLIALRRAGVVRAGERVAVLFTGIER